MPRKKRGTVSIRESRVEGLKEPQKMVRERKNRRLARAPARTKRFKLDVWKLDTISLPPRSNATPEEIERINGETITLNERPMSLAMP